MSIPRFFDPLVPRDVTTKSLTPGFSRGSRNDTWTFKFKRPGWDLGDLVLKLPLRVVRHKSVLYVH